MIENLRGLLAELYLQHMLDRFAQALEVVSARHGIAGSPLEGGKTQAVEVPQNLIAAAGDRRQEAEPGPDLAM